MTSSAVSSRSEKVAPLASAATNDSTGHWPLAGATSGWRAELALRFARRGNRSLLSSRRRSGPLMVQRPFHPEGDEVCHTYLLHPPAGIVGGDDLRVSVDVEHNAHALMTTPGATRWYFSRGIDAQSQQVLTVEDGATLEWLPQETLIFDGAHANLLTRVDLQGSARFCGWEVLGLGRPALGEAFEQGKIVFRFEIFKDGSPVLLERQQSGVAGLPGLRGNTACATFITTNADSLALEASREVLSSVPDAVCASTLLGDVLVARGIAPTCEPLTDAFKQLWSTLRPMTMGRSASMPRIWRT